MKNYNKDYASYVMDDKTEDKLEEIKQVNKEFDRIYKSYNEHRGDSDRLYISSMIALLSLTGFIMYYLLTKSFQPVFIIFFILFSAASLMFYYLNKKEIENKLRSK
jgi:hypothetical protein